MITHDKQVQWLTRQWTTVFGGGADSTDILNHLFRTYGAPCRKYHNVQHLYEVLSFMENRTRFRYAGDPKAATLAAWFHDYSQLPHIAEASSARHACRFGLQLGMRPHQVADAVLMIAGTHRHETDPGVPLWLQDADLGILAADPERYDEYARQIRQEYEHICDRQFTKARCAVLGTFLSRPQLYHCEHAHANGGKLPLQEQAHANMRRELHRLGAR